MKYDSMKTEDNESLVLLINRHTVVVEFIVEAESSDDAQIEITELIQEGILTTSDENKNLIYSYDIVSSEPAEVEI